jgi:hypothetical protein
MTQNKDRRTKPEPKHRVLREVLRHYLEFRDYVAQHGGDGVIEYGYFVYNEDGSKTKVGITISFWDLFYGLKELSPRKREAVWYNVIQDKLQREVAEIMNITTVSVGQYVEQAMLQLSERYFAEDSDSGIRIECTATDPD